MSIGLEKLFKTEEEIKIDILSDFTNQLLDEVENIVSIYGKEELMKMISNVK
ncbi:hypothetical protein P8610_18155 [Fictibacillus sp. UD]|uniref:hypothetical protein n=1 Tax=Fictibacillus sp. UD TaxID=3038777 RepID=UPI0037473194